MGSCFRASRFRCSSLLCSVVRVSVARVSVARVSGAHGIPQVVFPGVGGRGSGARVFFPSCFRARGN
eukprot:gene15668-biopygen4354